MYRTKLLLAVVALFLVASPALAAEGGSLSAMPAQLVLDQKGSGSVAVLNDSAASVTVNASMVDAAGAPVSNAEVHSPEKIASGGRGQITVTVPTPNAGAELVIVSPDVAGEALVLRVPIKANSAVSTWTLRRSWPADPTDLHGQNLPIVGACGQVRLPASEQPIGVVQADGTSVAITAHCASSMASAVELDAAAMPWNGRTYTGTVDLDPTTEGATVELTLVATTQWWIVAALLGLGVVVALLVTYWINGARGASQLIRQTYLTDELVSSKNPHNADAEFARIAEAHGLPESLQKWTVKAAVTARTRQLRKALRTDRSASSLTDSETKLAVLDTLIRTWPDVANTLGELWHREYRIEDLGEYRQRVDAQTFGRDSATLTLEEMQQIAACAREAANEAADWPFNTIRAADELAQQLPRKHPARVAFDIVMTQFAVAPDRATAHLALDDFWEVYRELRTATVPALVGEEAADAGASDDGGTFAPEAATDPKASARKLSVWIATVDYGITAVLVVASVLTGMQTLYVNKAFGGWWDVGAAVAWGLGAGALAVPLSAALTRWTDSARASLLQG